MPKALLLENLHPQARSILEAAGFDVTTRTGALDEAELIEALDGVQLLGIRSKTHVTAEVLAHAPDLVAIGAFCIGTNQIDLAEAAARGVATFNAPFSNTRSVVEIAIADIISLTRRLTEFDKAMHDGVWNKSATGAHEIRGRTLGIIGYGNIGTQLSVLAENLGMSVVFYDTAEKLALGNARRMDTLDELLETADIVTLHVDGRSGNAGLFGAKQFARMRPGAVFLNLSRGFVVDYAALRDAIVSGHVGGAADRRVPRRAQAQGRPVRVRAARPAQRHPHAAHRRLDRGGAGGHRPVRVEQGARLPGHRLDDAERQPAEPRARAAARRAPPRLPAPQRARRAGRGQRDARRARREHRGPAARHPRRARLRGHRRRRAGRPRRRRRRCRRGPSPCGCACCPDARA